MREIKFRAWDKKSGAMVEIGEMNVGITTTAWIKDGENARMIVHGENADFMQFTGLKDASGIAELYEGDIIDADGNLKGNIYESPQIYEKGTDCLVEGLGTAIWRDTESIAMGRGCKYAKQ